MKHRLLLFAVAAVFAVGCSKRDAGGGAPQPSAEPPPVAAAGPEPGAEQPMIEPDAGVMPTDEPAADCDAEAAKQFIGEHYTPELGERARVAAGARIERPLRPGQIVTMEFLSDRLTLTLDESGRISSVNCG